MVTGSENPDTSQPIGGVSAGTGISVTPTGVISMNPASQLTKIIAGENITISPTTGVGEVTITYTPPARATDDFPIGTKMLFLNAAAPAGWAADGTNNDSTLRLVSGAGGGAAGTVAFSAAFTNITVTGTVAVSGTAGGNTSDATVSWSGSISVGGSVGATALSQGQIAGSSGQFGSAAGQNGGMFNYGNGVFAAPGSTGPTGNIGGQKFTNMNFAFGGSQSHTHSLTGSGSFSGGQSTHSHNWTGNIGGSGSFSGNTIDLAVKYVSAIQCTYTG